MSPLGGASAEKMQRESVRTMMGKNQRTKQSEQGRRPRTIKQKGETHG